MELGLFLSHQVNRQSSIEDVYSRMIEYAIQADRSGFNRLWLPEHHLINFIVSPSPLISAAAIGQHVKCRVGSAVIVLPYHNPLQLAGEIAQTDHLLDGRFDLGVARGAYRYEFDKFGLDIKKSREHFIEMMDALNALFENTETPTTFKGEHINFEESYIWPRPVQKPNPPIWIGAQSLPAIEDAASRGLNVFHSLFLWDDNHLEDVAAAFVRGKERAPEGSSPKLGVSRYAFAVDSKSDVEPILQELLQGWRIHQQLHDFTHNADERGIVKPVHQKDEPSLSQLRNLLLIGTTSDIVEKIKVYKRLGIDVLTMNGCFDAPHDMTLRSIELLGQFADV